MTGNLKSKNKTRKNAKNENAPSNWSGTTVAVLKDGKKLHGLFGTLTVGPGKTEKTKKGFYGIYVNKNDEPNRAPDSVWPGETIDGGYKDLNSYWISASDIKKPDPSKISKCVNYNALPKSGICYKTDGRMFIKSKKVFDEWCGKVMTAY